MARRGAPVEGNKSNYRDGSGESGDGNKGRHW